MRILSNLVIQKCPHFPTPTCSQAAFQELCPRISLYGKKKKEHHFKIIKISVGIHD